MRPRRQRRLIRLSANALSNWWNGRPASFEAGTDRAGILLRKMRGLNWIAADGGTNQFDQSLPKKRLLDDGDAGTGRLPVQRYCDVFADQNHRDIDASLAQP